MQVVFATTDHLPAGVGDPDRSFHEAAWPPGAGELVYRSWRDPGVGWSAYDLVVLRSVWDYPETLPAFLTWLESLDGHARVANPVAVARWNLDKSYLADLADRGVPVVPTTYCSTANQVAEVCRAAPGEIVVKPAVSAGSRRTGRFVADDPRATDLAANILDGGGTVMVQPAIASVTSDGEVSAICFDGNLSHAVRRGPILARGGGMGDGDPRLDVGATTLSPAQAEVVDAATAATAELVAERFGVTDPLLYARWDLVRLADGSAALLEAELVEPCFFLSTDPKAPDRFAEAVIARAGGRP